MDRENETAAMPSFMSEDDESIRPRHGTGGTWLADPDCPALRVGWSW